MKALVCAFALDLADEPQRIAGYEHRHKAEKAWPKMRKSLLGSGITNREIYNTGNLR